MINFIVKPKETAEDNLLGDENARKLRELFLEQQGYTKGNLQKIVEGIECSNPDHKGFPNVIRIDLEDETCYFHSCCDDFEKVIRNRFGDNSV